MKRSDQPIVVENKLNGNVDLVWSVITDLAHMKKWFFRDIPEFQPKEGFETNFIINTGERSFDHQWKIIEVDIKKKITYKWSYKGYKGISLVHFELFRDNEKTLVKLTANVLEDFPQNIPEFRRKSAVGGWDYFIKESLSKYIDSLSG